MKRLFVDAYGLVAGAALVLFLSLFWQVGNTIFLGLSIVNEERAKEGRAPLFLDDPMAARGFRLPERAIYRGSVYFGDEHYPCEIVLKAKDRGRGQDVEGTFAWLVYGKAYKPQVWGGVSFEIMRLDVSTSGDHALAGAVIELRSEDVGRSLNGAYRTPAGQVGRIVASSD